MENAPAMRTEVDPGLVHTQASLLILGAVIITCTSLLLLAHDARYESWSRRYRWEELKRTKRMFTGRTHIVDDADQVVNEEIPSTDCSRGGIYFLGTSNLQWGLKIWDLPASQARYFHNFAFNASGHRATDPVDPIPRRGRRHAQGRPRENARRDRDLLPECRIRRDERTLELVPDARHARILHTWARSLDPSIQNQRSAKNAGAREAPSRRSQ